MKTIYFVGIHNKPGKAPLCSSTRSGKLIDRVIQFISIDAQYQVIKTNLYDQETMPADTSFTDVYTWAQRVDYKSGSIIVTLGDCVHQVFKGATLPYISCGHPSRAWSNKSKEEYVIRTGSKIIRYNHQ